MSPVSARSPCARLLPDPGSGTWAGRRPPTHGAGCASRRRRGEHRRSRRHRHARRHAHAPGYARARRCPAAGDADLHRQHRARRGALHCRAIPEFSAAVDHRWHRPHPPRHFARPRARPDSGAGEFQAPAPVRAGQRERLGGPRLGRGGSQRHSAGRPRNRRSAARRRFRAIRLGRHRRRHQPAPARCA